MALDDLLPIYDVSDSVATLVEADTQTTWEALLDVDLLEVPRRTPAVGALMALRMLPEMASHLLHGERPARAPERMRLLDTAELPADAGGWIKLEERPGEELALGLVGKFWRPVIEFADVDPGDFRDFDEPGFAKTVYALGVRQIDDDRTLLWGAMRTATTDEKARRWFRRYWAFGVGSGAHLLVHAVLERAREEAEGRDPDAAC